MDQISMVTGQTTIPQTGDTDKWIESQLPGAETSMGTSGQVGKHEL